MAAPFPPEAELTPHPIAIPSDLSTPILSDLYPVLDFVARKSSRNVNPIHKHIQIGRRIVLTEDVHMHLVRDNAIVYIKPIPLNLLCHAFWADNLADGPLRSDALGFMRSYVHLIRYPSDFALAQAAFLLPADVAYPAFATFMAHFADVHDADVAPRWHFGQIRLSRLNWAVRLCQPKSAKDKGLMRKLFYHPSFWQTKQLVLEFAAPLLFGFAALSLILSAMQVILSAKAPFTGGWATVADVSVWFAVVTVLLLVVVIGLIAGVVGVIWMGQIHYGYQSWRSSRAASAR